MRGRQGRQKGLVSLVYYGDLPSRDMLDRVKQMQQVEHLPRKLTQAYLANVQKLLLHSENDHRKGSLSSTVLELKILFCGQERSECAANWSTMLLCGR